MRRVIDKDGAIHIVPIGDSGNGGGTGQGFRKGMMPLRDMKRYYAGAQQNAQISDAAKKTLDDLIPIIITDDNRPF